MMLKGFSDGIAALERTDSNFACLEAFQAGFLVSDAFHRFLYLQKMHGFYGFHRFHRFPGIPGHGLLTTLKNQVAAAIQTFVRLQAGFLTSEDFHRILWMFIDFR